MGRWGSSLSGQPRISKSFLNVPGFADWRKRRGCWKTLKVFSPGARTPPPESMSRWSYHVSCLFHRIMPGKKKKENSSRTCARSSGERLLLTLSLFLSLFPRESTIFIPLIRANSTTSRTLFSLSLGKLFHHMSVVFLSHIYSALWHARLISHCFRFLVRSSVRPSVRPFVLSFRSFVRPSKWTLFYRLL